MCKGMRGSFDSSVLSMCFVSLCMLVLYYMSIIEVDAQSSSQCNCLVAIKICYYVRIYNYGVTSSVSLYVYIHIWAYIDGPVQSSLKD